MRSVAEQTDQELGGRASVLVRQKRDHVRLDELLRRLGSSEGDEQEQVLLAIDRLVFPHAFAEESVLWPVLRRVLPDGDALTLEVEREHQEVNELVTRLEQVGPGDDGRGPLLDRLAAVLRDDVRDEEDELFPRLQEVLSRRRLQLLGVAWEAVRRVAPTRAHPVVARRPPGNVVAALPLSVLDRIRDRVDRRRLSGGGAARLGRVSDRLDGLANRIEHLPAMRRGEDPWTSLAPPPRRSPLPLVIGLALGAGALLAAARIRSRRR